MSRMMFRGALRIPKDLRLPSPIAQCKDLDVRNTRSGNKIFHSVPRSFYQNRKFYFVCNSGTHISRPVLNPLFASALRHSPMTSRAVLYSLRSLRSHRVLFNGRRARFLDSLVYYGGAVHGRRVIPHHATSNEVPRPLSIQRATKTSTFHCSSTTIELETEFTVDISSEGSFQPDQHHKLTLLASTLQEDVMAAMKYLTKRHKNIARKEVVELSLILTDDDNIQSLNQKYLSVNSPTDVLSFPLDGIGNSDDDNGGPIMMLGDIVLSIETAERQGKALGHDLMTECRILIVHGLLHLLGYDHDKGDKEWKEMAELERSALKGLGWKGKGLIADFQRIMLANNNDLFEEGRIDTSTEELKNEKRVYKGNFFTPSDMSTSSKRKSMDSLQSPTFITSALSKQVQLVALDMDGTLMTSDQRISDLTKEAIQETIERGIQVVVATGKARPAALRACEEYGLSGHGSLISRQSAGIFLQGLVVYTTNGETIERVNLPFSVVKTIFEFSQKMKISCVAFTGDETITLELTSALIELHERYYEPLPHQAETLAEILQGKPVKKLILMTDPDLIKSEIQPQLNKQLSHLGSKTVVSVEGMLEIIPVGVNKWTALESLLASLDLVRTNCMAIGDGENDYEMVKNSGIGVAMGNAVPSVKAVSDLIVASNDEDGIAEALDRVILS